MEAGGVFYAVTRTNYKVNAEEEAQQIKEAKQAFAVKYEGMRTFIVFEDWQDLDIYNQFKARAEA
jgi:hypothetical protein